MPSPQRVQWAKFRIAVVAVVATCVLSVLVYLLGGNTWLQPKTYLTTHIPDSTGVEPGADVQLNGVLIGKVESVRMTHSLDPNQVVEVRLRLLEAFRRYIPNDSVTGIDSANLLGDKFIDIHMGRSSRPAPAGGELQYRAASFMEGIDLRQFDEQLRIIDQILQDMQAGKGPLGEFIVTDALYQEFVDGVARVEKKIRAATTSQSQLGQALYSSTMHDNLVSSLRQLDDRLAQLQSSPLMRESTQYDSLRDQLTQARQKLKDLNANAFIASDDAYVEWTRLLKGWIGNIDALNAGQGSMGQMLSNAQTYESLNGSLRELRTTVEDFREHPRRFLRIRFKLF